MKAESSCELPPQPPSRSGRKESTRTIITSVFMAGFFNPQDVADSGFYQSSSYQQQVSPSCSSPCHFVSRRDRNHPITYCKFRAAAHPEWERIPYNSRMDAGRTLQRDTACDLVVQISPVLFRVINRRFFRLVTQQTIA